MRKNAKKSGMTLVELLVFMSLALSLMGSMMAVLRQGNAMDANAEERLAASFSGISTLAELNATPFKELVDEEGNPELKLRVFVQGGGCSGFSYEMYFDTDRADDDVTKDFGGVDVVVDPQSAQLLEGATLDYKDGLQDAGFAIDNPNAQRTCGCGQSFS